MSHWPMVPIRDLMTLREPDVEVYPDRQYHFAGVYCFGKGLFTGEKKMGLDFSYKRLTCLRKDDFVYPKLMAWEGAFAVVPSECEGLFVSTEFPVFSMDQSLVLPEYISSYFKLPAVWTSIAGSSTGTNVRRRRLNPSDFLDRTLPLPAIDEQRHLIARIRRLAERIGDAQSTMKETQEQSNRLLISAYALLARGASRKRLGDIAPLVRRPATVDPYKEYPQVSVRSFGRGPFHNPPLRGSEITWEKPHLVKAGDILISNIKAWEGAIAVARPEDDGRYGSHRYLTFVPIPGVVTPRFLCYYLLSSEGLHRVGEASPGSADRNRTTSSRALLEIPVPVPSYERQLWFGELYDKVESLRRLQTETSNHRKMMIPSFINRTFQGKL